jgi:hypothetical protein
MIERGEEKGDPDLIDTIGDPFGRQIDLDAEGREDVCTPRLG